MTDITALPSMDQLVEIMKGILSGINDKIRESTIYLKRYIKVKESVGLLTVLVSDCNDVGLRHLAAVLMK
jgi:hypothetical protein